jgi:hypothetical protein
MSKVKAVFDFIIASLAGIGCIAMVLAWLVTIISITFGAAIWSTNWLWSML